MHFLSLSDQFITEIRMSNRDQGLSFLPGGKSFEINNTIFGYEVMNIGTCICYNRTIRQSRTDSGIYGAILSSESRRHANEGFTTVGKVSA